MLRSCKYCGRVHDESFRCAAKPVKKKERDEDVFRSSYAWKKKRQAIMARDGWLCRVCLLNEEDTRDKYTATGLSVHHIEPLHEAFERRLDDGNLITLCETCHDKAEKGEIGRDLLHRIAAEKINIPPGE